jgi:urea transporter
MNEQRLFPAAPYLRGVGQIMLQQNAWTGLFFLAGIFYDSVIMGVGAVLAVLTGTLTAKLLKYDKGETDAGLYGFSAALVGVALTFYFEPTAVVWIAVILGSAAATVLQHFLIKRKIAGFTLPFILVTWAFLYLFHHVYPVPLSSESAAAVPLSDDFAMATYGFGEVIFQGSLIAGIIFFVGVFISSPIAALYGVAASLLAAFISARFAEPPGDIHMGLLSFNAVLCAIAFAGDRWYDGVYVLLAVLISVFLDIAMLSQHLSVLTFPFVVASFITVNVKNEVNKNASRKLT